MKKKKAFITGVSGQDGSYLAKLLLEKGYEVVGGERINTEKNYWRLKELKIERDIRIIPFELLDENNINKVIKSGKYSEFYNLAAQSFVNKSFLSPVYTTKINALSVVNILEAIKNFSRNTRFYQASSSEMFGKINTKMRNEKTNFIPVSPYAISKLYAHWMLDIYRDVHKLYCCSGILFNHDSPLRGEDFVTKKIVSDLIKIKLKKKSLLTLGNIYVRRDWGYSNDYVEAMWKMLQQKKADDYVISSGITHNVKTFVNKVAKNLEIDLIWKGEGLLERAIDKYTNKTIVRISKKFFRPNEIDHAFGSSSKAHKILKWKPKTDIDNLVRIMCEAELRKYKK